MAAYPCKNTLPGGAPCEAAKSHPIHLRITPGHHEYMKDGQVGLRGVGKDTQAYLDSKAHKDAYAVFDEDKTCWPAAHGAPKECFGEITPSHSASRTKVGGLKAADKYPVPPACARHNAGQQDDTEIRAWAEVTYFTWKDGQQYPFLITDEWLTAERARSIRL